MSVIFLQLKMTNATVIVSNQTLGVKVFNKFNKFSATMHNVTITVQYINVNKRLLLVI